jgi:hypothetical protein
MDALNSYGLAVGLFLALLSSGATFFNKQRFIAQNELLQAGNDELRKQLADLRIERTDLEKSNLGTQVRLEEQRKLVEELKKQPNLTGLTKLISNNHTEVVTVLGEITKIVAQGNNDGKKR